MRLPFHRTRITLSFIFLRQHHFYSTQKQSIPTSSTMSPPPPKRQKRTAEVAAAQAQSQSSGGGKKLQDNKENAGTGEIKMPKKKFYRQRAHANPFSDHQLDYPLSPAHMDWAPHFPAFMNPDTSKTNLSGARELLKDVEVVDIGCGYGGLLVGLAPLLPETLMVGMEIRTQVLDYLQTRIQALRYQQNQLKNSSSSTSTSTQQPPSKQQEQPDPTTATAMEAEEEEEGSPNTLIPGNYENISAIRSNTMKFLPNFFGKHQLSKIFICFPDPHFKNRKHKARIISETLNAEYAYVLRPGGFMYTITDVEEYHHWILKHFRQESPVAGDEDGGAGGVTDLFERVSEEELERDPSVRVMKDATEEGKKVTRNKGHKFVAVFRRKADPEWPA